MISLMLCVFVYRLDIFNMIECSIPTEYSLYFIYCLLSEVIILDVLSNYELNPLSIYMCLQIYFLSTL